MEPAPAPVPPPSLPRPSWLGSLAAVLGPGLAAILLLSGVAWWMATTAPGLRLAATLVNAIVPSITFKGVDGSLMGGLRAASFVYTRESWSLSIEDLVLEPRAWTLWDRRLDVERVSARRVHIDWVSDDGPGTVPASLGLPFDLVVRQGNIQELALGARGAPALAFQRIELAATMGPTGLDVARITAEVDRTRIAARGSIGALLPFPTQAYARLETSAQERTVVADIEARGSLQELTLELRADDDAARAKGTAILRVFDEVPLGRLQAEVEAFDPALWFNDVPTMQLRARAELLPTTRADGRWSVSGPFSVENSMAGPVNKNRAPLRSLRGSLDWGNDTLKLDIARAEGVRGTAHGTLTWSTADGLAVQAQFNGIDAATLHSGAVTTNATGQVTYTFSKGVQRFNGSARNASGLPLSADVVASIRDQVLELSTARLQLGAGRADLRGRL